MDFIKRCCFTIYLIVLMFHRSHGCAAGRKKLGSDKSTKTDNPIVRNSAVKNMLGNNINLTPDDSSGFDQKGGVANGPNDLQCSFESNCCWKNSKPPYDSMEFVKATGQPDPKKFQSNFGTSTTPTGTYLIVVSDQVTSSIDKAIYMSCSICPTDNVVVTLKHWQTSSVQIKVCLISPSDPSVLIGCQPLPSTSPGPDTATITPLQPGQNYNIVIVASNFVAKNGSVAIIDDISVQYTPCNSVGSPTPGSIQPLPIPPPIPVAPVQPVPTGPTDPTECKKIACNFDPGSMCGYNAGNGPWPSGGQVKMFENHQNVHGNLATGVRPSPDGSYASAYLKPKETAYMEVLSNFDTERVIKFLEYKATENINIKACCNTVDNCLYDAGQKVMTYDYGQWYRGAILCPQGTRKFIFFAQNLGTNTGGVGVDQVQVFKNNAPDDINNAREPLC